jgi:dephospho-CoA kinase
MKIFEVTQPLEEGPNDPHIFKAVFMAGGPGSGKSYVASKLFKGTGLRMINSDEIYEYMMGKENLPLDPDTIFSPRGQEIRDKAKQITNRKQSSHLDGRLGLIIDGTGKDVAKIDKANEILRELGYDTIMLFVNTSLEIAQDRNLQRPRSLDPKQVDKMWNAVQQNIMAFQQVFGSANFYVVDNSGGLEDPDRAKNFNQVEKNIRKFLSSPPSNRAATKWIADQKSSVLQADEV